MDIKSYISDLDTNRFGFKVAKINDFDGRPEEILELFKENGVKLIISKINSENIILINALEKLKFLIKDIQVTYRYDLINHMQSEVPVDPGIKIRDMETADISQLKKIAAESFKDYGHYFEDKMLNVDKCNEIYVDWIERSCKDKKIAEKIIVAECEGSIVGFLSFKIYNSNGQKYAAGGLGAVAEKFRSRNVFRRIAVAGLDWGKELKLDWEEHNTLINNYPVNRSFSKLGFKIYKSFLTMHHWI